jgi:hypothetical protein
MGNAKRDENFIPTLLGTSSVTGLTDPLCVDVGSSNSLCVSDGTIGSDLGIKQAPRDENRVPAIFGVSSVDGITPTLIYTDGDNNLLVQST